MKNLFETTVLTEIMQRIDRITPETKAVWGEMNVSQMMEHCARALDFASGTTKPPRSFIGLVMGSFFKPMYYGDKPFSRGTPTASTFKMADTPDFETSKSRLKNNVMNFSHGGEALATTHPSPFFGKLTQHQHGLGQYKHIDHHLTQFGV